MDLKDEIKHKKAELLDLQVTMSWLQQQMQIKMAELNELFKQSNENNPSTTG